MTTCLNVMASPTPTDSNPLKVPFIGNTPGRADLLILIDNRGKLPRAPVVPVPGVGAGGPVAPTAPPRR